MIEGKHKRKHEDYQRSSLYIIESDETIEYSDKSGDSATIVYQIKDGQHGLYANEFRPVQVPKHGSKIIDLSMGIDDFKNKKCIWGLYDLKTNLGGKDDAMKLGGQWQAALRYWYNSVLNYLDGYTKNGKIGVVTTCYKEGKITEYIDSLKKKIEDAEKLNGTLIGAKSKADLSRVKKELDFFEKFIERKFVYLDPDGNEEIWDFEVISSSHHVFMWTLETSMA